MYVLVIRTYHPLLYLDVITVTKILRIKVTRASTGHNSVGLQLAKHTTPGDSPLNSSSSSPGTRHEGSRGTGAGAILCPAAEKGGPSSGGSTIEGIMPSNTQIAQS